MQRRVNIIKKYGEDKLKRMDAVVSELSQNMYLAKDCFGLTYEQMQWCIKEAWERNKIYFSKDPKDDKGTEIS